MTTKEKLDLLWKYLLLLVLIYGFAQIGRAHHPSMLKGAFPGPAAHSMLWKSGGHGDFDDMMDVRVEIEKMADGDSTVVVMINGKPIDLDDMELKEMMEDGHRVFMKRLDKDGEHGERRVKIIKKKLKDK